VSQQINLFNPIFLKQKKYFSAITMVQALVPIIIGCGLLVLYVNFQVSHRVNQANETANQLLATKAQLISISAKFAPQEKNQTLDDNIKRTQAEIKSMQRVFDALQNGEFGDTNGYSSYFRAFSRQIIDGLWLTGIDIYGAGHDISLQGRALNPELVPVYLTRLKRESEMQGKSFSALDMQAPKLEVSGDTKLAKAPMPAGYVEFNLQSLVAADAPVAGVKSK
jgi:hypothetical protein